MTEEIHRIYGIQIPILDIDSVVKRMNGKVTESDFTDVRKTGDESFEISIHMPFIQRHNKLLRKFKIARMLAKLFLDLGFENNSDKWQNANTAKERLNGQYNDFAAAFLMPKDAYLEQMKHHTTNHVIDTKAIADHFHVSISDAHYRGVRLGLLKNF